MTSVIA